MPKRAPTLRSQAAYEKWSAHYLPVARNPLMHAEETAMLGLMPPLDGKTILDLACGSGRYTRHAFERGAAHVIGIDNSRHMIAVGQREGVPASFTAGEMTAIPLREKTIDVILCGLAIGHIRDIQTALSEMAR
ncbi:MAG: class I SAM-dependent methyltransferase, partial [Chloroflexota bacterium]